MPVGSALLLVAVACALIAAAITWYRQASRGFWLVRRRRGESMAPVERFNQIFGAAFLAGMGFICLVVALEGRWT